MDVRCWQGAYIVSVLNATWIVLTALDSKSDTRSFVYEYGTYQHTATNPLIQIVSVAYSV